MSTADRESEWTTIPLRRSTHERVKACKRGGQSFGELLNAMIKQYDPAEGAAVNQHRVEGSQGR